MNVDRLRFLVAALKQTLLSIECMYMCVSFARGGGGGYLGRRNDLESEHQRPETTLSLHIYIYFTNYLKHIMVT